ncbi:indole-3-glycerol phosphate synthase TrpC [Flavobacterium silvaticum]|uniref:Indole-3-glycerol phosphate synthase n=1 Tax=Flavobacterium silvaticum TaxID=1852020 RepID=A0A972FXS8_9FLAO|nr:indole-3-glycerol phosphate synthase TrpC [Flavobacterium silvaticum]NMH26811.1 indole-3-glycerol phosphate synthase TrpC [Flavobacterium silvaticum]
MNILEKIAYYKRIEVERTKKLIPVSYFEASPLFDRKCVSLAASLRSHTTGIIAEHKRRSPSRTLAQSTNWIDEIVADYQEAGAAGMSILTDGKFFGGSTDDLQIARSVTDLPILRKEFIIDEYQILQSKAIGADAILLIAALLSPEKIQSFTKLAVSLGLEILLEVHDSEELEKSVCPGIGLIGVNNRNLKTMEIDLETSFSLVGGIPKSVVKISESGIKTADEIKRLKQAGFDGFLIGDQFMTSENPYESVSELIKSTL